MADEETTAPADDSIIRPTPEEVATIPEVKYEYLDHPADIQIHSWGHDLREAFEQAATGMFGYMTEIDTVEMVEVREVKAEAEDLQGLLFHFLDECLFEFCCDPYFITRKVVITEWSIGKGVGGSVREGGDVGGEKGPAEGEKGDVGGKEGGVEEEGSVGGEGGNVGDEKGTVGGEGGNVDEKGTVGGEGGNVGDEKGTVGGEGGNVGGEKGTVGDEKGTVGGEGGNVGDEKGTVGGEGGNVGGDAEDVGVMKVCARLYGEEFQLGKHPQGTEVKAITYASMQVYNEPDKCQVYVIVDI